MADWLVFLPGYVNVSFLILQSCRIWNFESIDYPVKKPTTSKRGNENPIIQVHKNSYLVIRIQRLKWISNDLKLKNPIYLANQITDRIKKPTDESTNTR